MHPGGIELLALGSDHAGFALKQEIMKHLDEIGAQYRDFGTYSEASCDYPDIAKTVCEAIKGIDVQGEAYEAGILVCGTGIGMSIAANKIEGIRAACCSDYFSAKYTRAHNDANVLCLGGRVIGAGLACELVDVFIGTPFSKGANHLRRIGKIAALETRGKAARP